MEDAAQLSGLCVGEGDCFSCFGWLVDVIQKCKILGITDIRSNGELDDTRCDFREIYGRVLKIPAILGASIGWNSQHTPTRYGLQETPMLNSTTRPGQVLDCVLVVYIGPYFR